MMSLIAFASILVNGAGEPEVKPVEYMDGTVVLEGQIAYAAGEGKRPAVLIVHDWNGIDDYEKRRTKEVAQLGYVAFAADIYGKGVRPIGTQACAAEAGKYYGDNALLRSRLKAAFDTVKKDPRVDKDRIAIIGYCFGGMCAIDAVRAGFGAKGAVSFHGGFKTANPAQKAKAFGKILVLHGDADQASPLADLEAMKKEMKAAGISVKTVIYPGVDHAFTVPGTTRYNEEADKASWKEMSAFLKQVLK